ncbi:hypothetical protein [Sulfolobus sp. E11-6]|uniref:hypothetical protein n=1 Tax=Sulfolobus sp. E11-6 TaxID=2663020 RepID=UPI001295D282|nr:hypothetical protein [Sulfolobus sp. E11-6]QGA68899.1 hypothetical protein GFS33_09355 [Sulfolobus sp. E11-6]
MSWILPNMLRLIKDNNEVVKLFYDRISILNRFRLPFYLYIGENNLKTKMIFSLSKTVLEIYPKGKWGIFMTISSRFINTDYLLDPLYINGVEDIDLLIRLYKSEGEIKILKNKVKDLGSKSLGTSRIRHYRNIINFIYFNYKILNKLLII